MKVKNKAAQELGRLNKGVRKVLSEMERQRRGLRLVEARKARWVKDGGVVTATLGEGESRDS